jgi:Glycosyl transferases group 1
MGRTTLHIVTMPASTGQAGKAPIAPTPTRTAARQGLFVVDWRSHSETDLLQRMADASPPGSLNWAALNAHTQAKPGAVRMLWDYLRTAFQVWRLRRSVDRIVVWQPRIALVLACLPWGADAAPWVVTSVLWSPARGSGPSSGLALADRLRRWALRLLMARADGIVFFSEELAQQARQAWPRWAEKVRVQAMPVVPPLRLTVPVAPPPVTGRYLFAGGRSERDLEVVCQALADAPWPVLVVGQVDERWLAKASPMSTIHVVPEVDETHFGQWARGASALLVTLRDADSPCGQLLIAEGLANGVPVVATDAFGPRALIRSGEEGLLVPAGDADALRQACHAVMEDPLMRARLTGQGRRRANQLGLPGFLKSMAAWPLRRGHARSA